MQFSIFSKNSLTLQMFFENFYRPILEEGVYVKKLQNQLASKEITNLQAMVAWLQNSINTFIEKNSRMTSDLGS